MNPGPASIDTPPRATEPAAHPGTLPEGAIFAGRYQVVRCLAVGGMGAIYEVVHVETNRRRALKIMHPHLFQSDEMRERFKREARIAADVESEYIVDVSDAGVDEASRTPFLVMELLHGEELGRRVRRLGHLSCTEALVYLQQVALALDKTHAKMLVHRDLKPENVFLTFREDGTPRVKILDFGVAKVVREGATNAGATRSLGTPLYMAPEQFRTSARLTPAADIYALGMMAFTLLVGEPYWTPEANASEDIIAFAMAAIRGPQESAVRRALARGVQLPPAFDGWFARMTAPNATDRFSHATEAIRALGEVLEAAPGDHPMVAFAPTSPTPPVTVSPPLVPTAVLPEQAVSPPGLQTPVLAHPTTPISVSLESSKPAQGHRAGVMLGILVLFGAATLGVGGWLVLRPIYGRSGVEAGATGGLATMPMESSSGTEQTAEPAVVPTLVETSSSAPPGSPNDGPAQTGALATPPPEIFDPPAQTGTLSVPVPMAAQKPPPMPTATSMYTATVTAASSTRTAARPPRTTGKKPPLIGQE